jgi:transcriptional regulator with XRE-family HTH domain
MTNEEANGPAREWLLKMAVFEDSSRSVSAGGLAADFGLLSATQCEPHRVFGRLIEFARRKQSLSVEQLAERAQVDLADIIEIEMNELPSPDARTVFQLASVLGLPSARLMEVAGLATPRPEVSSAALKFAARSEPSAKLSREERDALEEFVKVLVETSDRVD